MLGDKIGTQDKWENRRRAILDKVNVCTRFSELRKMVDENTGSLAVFRPTSVKLRCETARDDDEAPTSASPEEFQLDLFRETAWREDFRHVDPVPYDFKYEITDADGLKATHKILDWELGTLFYWEKKRLRSEEKARESVKNKYGVEFLNTEKVDLHLYMGTMLKFQRRHMPNPWTIIGVAPFPKVESRQTEFLL